MRYEHYKIAYQELNIKSFMERYHFKWQDTELIQAVARFLCEMIEVEVWLEERAEDVICAVTLGERYDEMEQLVEASGNLLLSFCMECVGLELLTRGYERIGERVHERTGMWLSKFDFLEGREIAAFLEQSNLHGEKKHLKEEQRTTREKDRCIDGDINTIVGQEKQPAIAWKNGMLRPLKSVVFRAQYRTKREQSGCQDCSSCDNVMCSFRKIVEHKNRFYENVDGKKESAKRYSYGAAMIFGGNEK